MGARGQVVAVEDVEHVEDVRGGATHEAEHRRDVHGVARPRVRAQLAELRALKPVEAAGEPASTSRTTGSSVPTSSIPVGIEYPWVCNNGCMPDTEGHRHPPGPVPRLPRDEVRRRLLTAAGRVFAERGYADSRLEDIARAAGFTKGAVYSNFGSKQELFGAVLSERSEAELSGVMAGFDEAADVSTLVEQAAHLVAQRIVHDAERSRLGLEIAARATRDEETRAVVTPMRRAQRAAAGGAVREVTERAGITPPVDPELAGVILHCLTNGLATEHLVDPEGVDATTAERALGAVLAWLIKEAQK